MNSGILLCFATDLVCCRKLSDASQYFPPGKCSGIIRAKSCLIAVNKFWSNGRTISSIWSDFSSSLEKIKSLCWTAVSKGSCVFWHEFTNVLKFSFMSRKWPGDSISHHKGEVMNLDIYERDLVPAIYKSSLQSNKPAFSKSLEVPWTCSKNLLCGNKLLVLQERPY